MAEIISKLKGLISNIQSLIIPHLGVTAYRLVGLFALAIFLR